MTSAPTTPPEISNVQLHLIIIIAIVNGIFSPFAFLVTLMHPLWFPSFLPVSLQTAQAVSSIMLSTLTLMIAGIPAAVYERWRGAGVTTGTSGFIWLAGVLLLTIPALPGVLRALGMGP